MQFNQDAYQKPPLNEFALLAFETYEDYLDSLYNDLDKCFLQNKEACRAIAENGFRRDSKTFSRQEFKKKRDNVLSYLSPVKPNIMASLKFKFGDPIQNALAVRERPNRVGVINTIIFVNYTTSKDKEISGYIDFAHSLLKKDWTKFWKEDKPIYPDRFDLGFYDWKKEKTVMNDSLYYKTLMTPHKGLIFQNKSDRMIIIPDPLYVNPGMKTTRIRIKSGMFNSCILMDHIVRSRK